MGVEPVASPRTRLGFLECAVRIAAATPSAARSRSSKTRILIRGRIVEARRLLVDRKRNGPMRPGPASGAGPMGCLPDFRGWKRAGGGSSRGGGRIEKSASGRKRGSCNRSGDGPPPPGGFICRGGDNIMAKLFLFLLGLLVVLN